MTTCAQLASMMLKGRLLCCRWVYGFIGRWAIANVFVMTFPCISVALGSEFWMFRETTGGRAAPEHDSDRFLVIKIETGYSIMGNLGRWG